MSKHALAATAVTLLLCGCSHTRTVTTKDGSVSVDQGKDGEGSVHAVGKDGSSVEINTGKPITDYPSDAPLYAGKSIMDIKSGEKHSRVVIVQTADSLGKISDFYKAQLDSKGWKVDTTLNSEKMALYTASKGDRKLVVQISAEDGKQSISQTLADK